MSIEGLTGFLADMGHTICTIDGTRWFDANPFIFTPLPYELEIAPDRMDWAALFRQRCLGARCAAIAPWGRPSFRLVIDSPAYNISCLAPKSRNQTRRGLE